MQLKRGRRKCRTKRGRAHTAARRSLPVYTILTLTEMASTTDSTKDDRESTFEEFADPAMVSSSSEDIAAKYDDHDLPLNEVASVITVLAGDLETHMHDLESVVEDIGEEVRALDRPSIAFKLTDLQTLIHSMIIKLRSYIYRCKDIAEFVANFKEDELQCHDEMLYFINEMNTFSSPMKEELDGIIKANGAAVIAIKEQRDTIAKNEAASQAVADSGYDLEASSNESTHQIPAIEATSSVDMYSFDPQSSTEMLQTHQLSRAFCNFCQRLKQLIITQEEERQHIQKAILDKCSRTLEKLIDEIECIRGKVVEKYTRNITTSLNKYKDASDEKGLAAGILKIRQVCMGV